MTRERQLLAKQQRKLTSSCDAICCASTRYKRCVCCLKISTAAPSAAFTCAAIEYGIELSRNTWFGSKVCAKCRQRVRKSFCKHVAAADRSIVLWALVAPLLADSILQFVVERNCAPGFGLRAERDYAAGELVTRYGGLEMHSALAKQLRDQAHHFALSKGFLTLVGNTGYARNVRGRGSLCNTVFGNEQQAQNAKMKELFAAHQSLPFQSTLALNCKFSTFDCVGEPKSVWLTTTAPVKAGHEFFASYGRNYKKLHSRSSTGKRAKTPNQLTRAWRSTKSNKRSVTLRF